MTRKLLYTLGGVLGVVLVGGVAYLAGGTQALGAMDIEAITADQAARAMSDDNFYGLYRAKTLVVSGTVASVTLKDNAAVIEFSTGLVSKAYCSASVAAGQTVKVGDTIRVLAEGFESERLSSGVLLKPCVVL